MKYIIIMISITVISKPIKLNSKTHDIMVKPCTYLHVTIILQYNYVSPLYIIIRNLYHGITVDIYEYLGLYKYTMSLSITFFYVLTLKINFNTNIYWNSNSILNNNKCQELS